MDCMNSFYITINNSTIWTGADITVWGAGSNLFFLVEKSEISTFNIEGFKNINVFSIEMTGSCVMDPAGVVGECVINDYGFFFNLNGVTPQISGRTTVSPNYWNINTIGTQFSLSKMSSKITFESPIQSLSSINFTKFFASGIGATTPANLSVFTNLTFMINYKYEGEDSELAFL